jgi:hypothetical protein
MIKEERWSVIIVTYENTFMILYPMPECGFVL